MSQFQVLLQQSAEAREQFQKLPIIQEVLTEGGSLATYLDFLGQAYHHVKHTAPLLALAAARCRPHDYSYRSALFKYLAEEQGHEAWILEDIDALGGDAERVEHGSPRFACKIMVGHAYYLIDHVSPYGLLGMVHVLEGMSVALASKAARTIRDSLRISASVGFKYLTTHGELDMDHTRFFGELIDDIDPQRLPLVISSARDFYRLYAAMFEDIDAHRKIASAAPM
jgi:hypothetical protein